MAFWSRRTWPLGGSTFQTWNTSYTFKYVENHRDQCRFLQSEIVLVQNSFDVIVWSKNFVRKYFVQKLFSSNNFGQSSFKTRLLNIRLVPVDGGIVCPPVGQGSSRGQKRSGNRAYQRHRPPSLQKSDEHAQERRTWPLPRSRTAQRARRNDVLNQSWWCQMRRIFNVSFIQCVVFLTMLPLWDVVK